MRSTAHPVCYSFHIEIRHGPRYCYRAALSLTKLDTGPVRGARDGFCSKYTSCSQRSILSKSRESYAQQTYLPSYRHGGPCHAPLCRSGRRAEAQCRTGQTRRGQSGGSQETQGILLRHPHHPHAAAVPQHPAEPRARHGQDAGGAGRRRRRQLRFRGSRDCGWRLGLCGVASGAARERSRASRRRRCRLPRPMPR